ncbi:MULTISPECIES: helix-turn-helix domain-containing protein [unclassified Pseudomonas]|uniref:helix-turn-helix domain-containing protein n=1 Tax=unclassified Pseudomonas TaxID=196821 RepID=UPI0015A63E81|nr:MULTISPECIES: helix-turn-helix domain-containing protein [unclassified Pseudomonas]
MAHAAAYQVRVCAATSSVTTQAFDLRVRHSLDEVRGADTLVVPGLANLQDMVAPAVLDAIREAHAQGTRIAAAMARRTLEPAHRRGRDGRLCQGERQDAQCRFTEQMGISPVQWMIQARVDRAQCLLETTDLPIERVAAEVGFGSSVSLRQHFLHTVDTSPSAYRQAFRVTSGLCSYTGDTLES